VYDRSKKQSFDSVKTWMQELQEKGPENMTLAIVGNKIDILE
jgi:GTPase SAR1 family protein